MPMHGPSDSDHTDDESTRFKVDFASRCCTLDVVALEVALALCASVQLCSSTTWLTHVFLMASGCSMHNLCTKCCKLYTLLKFWG